MRSSAQSAPTRYRSVRTRSDLIHNSTDTMLRSLSLCSILALTLAQSGYEYNKPDTPFGTGTSPARPGGPTGSSGGYPTSPTSPTFSGRPQIEDFTNSVPGSTSGYPSGPTGGSTGQLNQGYPNSGQSPQTGYPGQGSTFPSPGGSSPGGYPTQGNSNYPGQEQNYPGQSGGSRPGTPTYGSTGPAFGSRPGSQDYVPGAPGFGSGAPGYGNADNGAYEGGDYSAIPGEPNIDYPIFTEIPQTSFRCDAQPYPGYYADVETRCQVFHICANNITYDFLCPNGTIFSQQVFVCVWWNQFDCNSAPSLYGLNANIYDYSKTGSSQGNYNNGYNDYSQGLPGPGSRPSGNYEGSQQGSNSYPGSSQNPSGNYPTSRPQTPSGLYQGSSQGPSANYPGNSGLQSPGTSYPTNSASQHPTSYPGSAGSQGPSSSYPGSTGSQGPSSSYPGSSVSQGPSQTQGPTSSYPGSQSSSYPSSSQGYPSGRPSGPSFPPGNSGNLQDNQNNSAFPPSQPNREYLPPRN